jgi:hypothetical protein
MRAEAIEELAEMLGIEKVRVRSSYVLISCPFASTMHGSGQDSHPSLSIIVDNEGRSGFRCHGCGLTGTLGFLVTRWGLLTKKPTELLFRFIDKHENPLEMVKSRIDSKVAAQWDPKPPKPDVDWSVFDEAELEEFGGSVPQYALDRGLTLATCKEWELGYDKEFKDSQTKRIRPRMTFPIRRKDGKLIGMIGRALDDLKQEKYYNYWHFQKSNYLYGMHKVEKRDHVIAVEGLFDVLKWWEYGLPVVGLMGSQPSEAQAKLLLEFEMVYLALDADEAGAKGTKWLKSRLKGRVPIYAVRFPEGKKDPGEMGKEEAWAAITTAKRIL